MIPSKKSNFSNILEIALDMKSSGIEESFIESVVRLSFDLEGIRDLMTLWSREMDQKERDEIVADLQDEIEEYRGMVRGIIEKPSVSEHQFDAIAKSIMEFKSKLRKAVDAWGGISKLSKETGIPQPSLSRFFNNTSMPRRTTLFKIAKAVGLKDTDITLEWVR